MKALITGGAGYFGSLLTNKLYERGYECRVLDIIAPDDPPPGIEFIRADIRDAEAVEAACDGVDIAHHNVAQVPLAKDRALFQAVNIGGMKVLLEACRKRRVNKVIYTSSSAVFGVPKELPITEDTKAAPLEAYGEAKYEAENVCRAAVNSGLDISIIRPRTILGHGRLGIFQILFEWVAEGRKIPVLGGGDNIYQFVHAYDLAEVCIRAGERAGPELYHCGAENFGTMREALEALCRHAGTKASVRSLPMGLAIAGMKITGRLGLSPLGDYHWLMYGRSMYFSTSKVKNDLGYAARYSNSEMICESYDWYMRHRDTIRAAGQGASAHKSALKQGILKILKWLS